MSTTAFNVSKVEHNSQSQTSGALSAESVSNSVVKMVTLYTPTDLNGTGGAIQTYALKIAPGMADGAVGVNAPQIGDFQFGSASAIIGAYIYPIDSGNPTLNGANLRVGMQANRTTNGAEIIADTACTVANVGAYVNNGSAAGGVVLAGAALAPVVAATAGFYVTLALDAVTTQGSGYKVMITYMN